jgi:hypothetical protein
MMCDADVVICLSPWWAVVLGARCLPDGAAMILSEKQTNDAADCDACSVSSSSSSQQQQQQQQQQ